MSRLPQDILWGEDVIGTVSAYPAFPIILCPRCGSKLFRVYDIQPPWEYLCKEEMALVDLQNVHQMLTVEIE